MLTIYTGRPEKVACDDRTTARRDFLQVGSLMLGSLSLPQLLQARDERTRFVKDKSVVLLYLSGGASQIETFDPKMTAPAEIRSVNGEVKWQRVYLGLLSVLPWNVWLPGPDG